MRPLRSLAGAWAATVIAGAALAGCGVSQGAVTQHRVNCGSSSNPAAVQCFDAALRNCRAASITQISMLVDTGTRETFVTVPGTSPCRVTEESQPYVVTGGIHLGPVTTTHCVDASAAHTVVLTCRGHAVPIPNPARPHLPAAQ
jgi:hypothetical protein